MTFAELKQELSDRGFAHLSDTRLGRYVNWARAELDELALWPYREASTTGVPPLIVSDLGVIEWVQYDATDRKLDRVDPGYLTEKVGDIGAAGEPVAYYLASPGGVDEVATYPVPTTSISVQYWKVTPDLTAAGNTPLTPARWHRLIVDIAVRMAYRDGDGHGDARALSDQIEADKLLMMQSLLSRSIDPQFIEGSGGEG